MLTYISVNITELDDEFFKNSFECMQPKRRERVMRIRNITQRKCTLAGEWLVRSMLSDATGMNPESFVILPDEKGKLYSKTTPDLFFNISHSQNTVVAVISNETVGIDVEIVRPVSLKLAKRVCTPDELAYVFGYKPADINYDDTPTPEMLQRFFEIWTIKEAYFKCIGTGITDFMSVDALNGNFRKKKITENNAIIHIVTL